MFNNPISYAGYPPKATGKLTKTNSTVRAATAAEAAAGVKTNCYISPATAESAAALDFATPPTLGFGSTTPRPVSTSALTATAPSVAGASPIINNSKQGQVSFTNVIVAGAYADLVMTNSTITASSKILAIALCATATSAVSITTMTPGAGTVTFKVKNDGAGDTDANVLINYWVMN